VNIKTKKYCIELTTNHLYINYTSTIPNGCNNRLCIKSSNIHNNKGLSVLFRILHIFLNHIEYKGVISLKDDSRINPNLDTKRISNLSKETNLVMLRLSQGIKKISIYEKYGFKMSSDIYNIIINAFNNNINELKKHIYNIPIKAENKDFFI
jgi:hypothetical protein